MGQHGDFSFDLASCLSAAGVIGGWLHDTVTDRVIADRAIAQLFKIEQPDYSNGDAIVRYAEAIHPLDRPAFIAEVARASASGTSFSCQYRVTAEHGSRYVFDFGSFELSEDGRPRRGRGIVVDVTDIMRRDITSVDHLTAPSQKLHQRVVEFADHIIAASIIAKELPSPRLGQLAAPLLWETGTLLARLDAQSHRRSRRVRRK